MDDLLVRGTSVFQTTLGASSSNGVSTRQTSGQRGHGLWTIMDMYE